MTTEKEHIHLLGIGGSGMLPLALLYAASGANVTGSDAKLDTRKRDILTAKNISAWHDSDVVIASRFQISARSKIVASPAIPGFHRDLRSASRLGVKVQSRAEALAELLTHRPCVCVGGSHGKSTTTAMLVHILEHANRSNFGYMIGARIPGKLPARLGDPGSAFVMEACEAHQALNVWQPNIAVLTSLGNDHSPHYGGEIQLKESFLRFLNRVPSDGSIVVNSQALQTLDVSSTFQKRALTFGFDLNSRLRAEPALAQPHVFLDGDLIGKLRLSVPGDHNQLNALAAIGAALSMGVEADTAFDALATFKGIERRLQDVTRNEGPRIYDDFAHHPTEVHAGISSVRSSASGRVFVVMQPQLHSRISKLAEPMASALAQADGCFILPVASEGETVTDCSGNDALALALSSQSCESQYLNDTSEVCAALSAAQIARSDSIIVMGGQSLEGLAEEIADYFDDQSRALSVQETERELSIIWGDRTGVPPDLLDQIRAHVRTSPHSVALSMAHRTLTYIEMWRRSENLAQLLLEKGVGSGDTVGVFLRPNIDRVVAFVATLHIGAVYIPLDPDLPSDRLKHIIDDASVRVIIVNAASPALPDGQSFKVLNTAEIDIRSRVLDTVVQIAPSDLAYIIYTSGTTGVPKGVKVPRKAISNYAVAAMKAFEITSKSRVSLVSAFGFDVNIGDMVMSLSAGAGLVLPSDIQCRPGAPMGRFIREALITHLSLTPSALSVIPEGEFPTLETIIVAGEPVSPRLVEKWGGQRRFVNAYGPTEGTVEVTYAVCRPGEAITIGRPFENTGICLVDDDMQLVPKGKEGEILILGAGLADGYQNLEEQTAAKFVELSLGEADRAVPAYRTGDRGKILANGEIEFLGRVDDQIKYLGYRIEPAEIEDAICSETNAVEVVVSKLTDKSGAEKLIAHLVLGSSSETLNISQLRLKLGERLPSYMIPRAFFPVPGIPLTPNGKRDLSALPVPPISIDARPEKMASTVREVEVLKLLSELRPDLEIQDVRASLYDAGVDSLGMAELLSSIEARYSIQFDIALEIGSDTVEFIALSVDAVAKAPQRSLDSDDISLDLLEPLRKQLVSWPGQKAGARGLLRVFDEKPLQSSLFWIFQSGNEFRSLHSKLVLAGLKIIGARSGHLLFPYTEPNLASLAQIYADEIEEAAPSGTLNLGGNCQGGLIAGRVASELQKRGRKIEKLFLMEQGRFPITRFPTVLIFGERSYSNPYTLFDDPHQLFQTAYPDGFNVEIIRGAHGQYFQDKNIESLSNAILKHAALTSK